MNKKLLLISILIVLCLSILSFVIYKKSQTTPQNNLQEATGLQTEVTLSDLRTHITPDDCWIVVDNNVYNISPYISVHPGGREAITQYCGSDATEAFQKRNEKGPHPKNASDFLNTLIMGPMVTK